VTKIPTPSEATRAYSDFVFGVWPEDADREGFLGSAADALETAGATWREIRSTHRRYLLDQTLMPLARVKASAKLAESKREATCRLLDSVLSSLNREIASLTEKLRPRKPMGVADAIVQGEVRSFLGGRSEADLIAKLDEAMKARDTVTLAAALHAPPTLLRISDDLRSLLLDAYARAVDPEGFERREKLLAAVSKLQRAGTKLIALTLKLIPAEVAGAGNHDLAAAKRAEQICDAELELARRDYASAPRVPVLWVRDAPEEAASGA
jgi:hypothetical protein